MNQGSIRNHKPQSKPKSFCKSFIVVNTVTNILALIQECSSNSKNITEKSQQINKHCCCFTEMLFFLYVFFFILFFYTLRVNVSVTFKLSALINTCQPTLLPATCFFTLVSFIVSRQPTIPDRPWRENIRHTLNYCILCSSCIYIHMDAISHNQFPTFHSH